MVFDYFLSNPQNDTGDPDSNGHNSPSKAEMEQMSRKLSLNLTTEVLGRTSKLLQGAKQRVNDANFSWDSILGSSALMTILLPLVLAHISRLATTDVKVSRF